MQLSWWETTETVLVSGEAEAQNILQQPVYASLPQKSTASVRSSLTLILTDSCMLELFPSSAFELNTTATPHYTRCSFKTFTVRFNSNVFWLEVNKFLISMLYTWHTPQMGWVSQHPLWPAGFSTRSSCARATCKHTQTRSWPKSSANHTSHLMELWLCLAIC